MKKKTHSPTFCGFPLFYLYSEVNLYYLAKSCRRRLQSFLPPVWKQRSHLSNLIGRRRHYSKSFPRRSPHRRFFNFTLNSLSIITTRIPKHQAPYFITISCFSLRILFYFIFFQESSAAQIESMHCSALIFHSALFQLCCCLFWATAHVLRRGLLWTLWLNFPVFAL